jgi:dihydrofolate synthase / folylpolyglutamate synthase
MTYKQAISYLYSLEEERISLGLSRIKSLLFYLGISLNNLKVIHIAGTNGKGSVVAMISSILSCAGFKVGTYTSPHLKDFRERIAIEQTVVSRRPEVKYIPEKKLVELVEKVKPAVKKISGTKLGRPTFFEVTTAIMFAYFIEEKVDFAVLETGLGGRLDATNIVLPVLSVITNVGLEHTDRLGNTLEEIAGEKCGIIKKGCPVITSEQKSVVLKVMETVSSEKKTKLIKVGRDIKYEFKGFDGRLQFFSYDGIFRQFEGLALPLFGKHQLMNASCAIAAIEILNFLCALHITLRTIRKGLLRTEWPGRCEVISRKPFIVVDGAHNPPAACVLVNTIKDYFHYSRLVLILGVLKDKDINGIINYLLPIADSVIFTSPANSRAVSPIELMKRVLSVPSGRTSGQSVNCASYFISESVARAVKLSRLIASGQDLILIAGSLYNVAGAREICR